MSLMQLVILAVIQGLAELLPVSSSAHVIAGAKLMGVNSHSPQFTLLLVMLHTGTMFAVILYFWNAWKKAFFSSSEQMMKTARVVIIATAITGILGFGLKKGIEHYLKHHHPEGTGEIEEIFDNLLLIGTSLAAVGVLILVAGLRSLDKVGREEITDGDATAIGIIQGLCLPFRGFSRSGSTISMGLLRGVSKQRLEEYSFALAVVLTPGVVGLEILRLIKHKGESAGTIPLSMHDFTQPMIGMVFSFIGGLIALKFLSALLEKGKWWVFGIYCLVAAGGVFVMHLKGY